MAKPDCDDGFMMLAHELFAALSLAGFNRWEWVVLREVLSQIYGPKRRKTATLSPSEIAGRLGTFKESIMRATKTLMASGVIVKLDGLEYRFVKDYERWNKSGSPLLNERETRCCQSAKTVNSGAHASTNVVNNGAHVSTDTVNNGAHGVNSGAHAPLAPALTIVNSGAHALHSEERAGLRMEKKKEEREKEIRAPSTSLRSGEDATQYESALSLLGGCMQTEGVAMELRRRATLPEIRSIEGWRWLNAARVMCKGAKAYTIDWLLGIARRSTLEEFEAYGKPQSGGKFTKPDPGPTNQPPPNVGFTTPEAKALHEETMAKYRKLTNGNRRLPTV